MSNGFARDITTPINIPNVQAPNFNQNRSGLEDAVDLASFGIGLHQKFKAEGQEKARQERVNAVSSAALNAQSMLEEIKLQKGTITSGDILRISRRSGGQFQSPTERQMFNSMLGEGISGPLFQSIVGDDLTETETTKTAIRKLSPTAVSSGLQSLGYNDINEVPDEEMGELEAVALNYDAKLNKLKVAKEAFIGSDNTHAFNDYMSTTIDTSIDLMTSNLQVTMTDLEGLGLNSPEYKERLGTLKKGMTNVLSGRLAEARQIFLQSKQGKTSEEIARMTQDFEITESALKGSIDRITNLSDDEWKSTLDLANNLKNEMSIEASESFPQTLMLQEVFKGGGFDEIMRMVLVQSEGKDLIAARVNKDLERGLVNSGRDLNVGAIASIASKKSLQELRGIFEGRSINDANLEDRKAVIEDRWNWVNTMIKDPELINSLSQNEEKMDKLGFAMIDILKTAETDGTDEDLVRANELLSSKAFGNYLSKIRPEEAEVVSRYVASSTALSLDKEFSKNSRMTYNTDSGKIERPVMTRQGKQKAAQDFGVGISGGKIDASSVTTTEKIKNDTKLQNKLENAADALVKYSPFLKGNRQDAMDYLMNTVADSQVKGNRPRKDFDQTQDQAIKNGISVAELEERFSAENRFETVEKDLADLQTKELERKAKGDAPKLEDTADLDDEEFEELIKQMRAERSGK